MNRTEENEKYMMVLEVREKEVMRMDVAREWKNRVRDERRRRKMEVT